MAECEFSLNAATHLLCLARTTILLLLLVPLANAQAVSFDHPNFSDADAKHVHLQGDAMILDSDSVIQLTGNASNPHKVSSVGRITYPNRVLLWDKNSNEVYDFTTKFSFVIVSNQIPSGDGLTFFLASTNLPEANFEVTGGGLGLVPVQANPQQLISTNYSFVAVEFDTFTNEWDPDSSHVGVNVNSIKSNKVVDWSADVSQMIVYNCSIQYNSRDAILNVSFTGYKFNEAPELQNLLYHIDLRENLPESVIVGISASTGTASKDSHMLRSWSFSTSLHSNEDSKQRDRKLFEGIGVGAGLSLSLLGVILVMILYLTRRKEKEEEQTSEAPSDVKMDVEFQMTPGPKKINYYELATATNNFEEKQKLGQGGFGGVYKGYLKDSNSYAAIKRLSANSRQGVKNYTAEVKIISQLRHRNLVKLTGWCHKKKDLLLVYEYMPNGSLDSHLFRGESILSWQLRYNIALGLASALFYLQEGWEKCVLHRDIKSSNIMLDCNFNAKLGDFGLARMVDHEKGSQTTVVAGTMGYLAPEYVNTGKLRKESDIFSFGVVLLEVACGRKAIHHEDTEGQVSLVEWVWELYGSRNLLAAADPQLSGVFDVQQMECLLVVGLWCANPYSKSRPSIRQVMKVLHFGAPLPILPQKIPNLAYPPTATDEPFLSIPSSFENTC